VSHPAMANQAIILLAEDNEDDVVLMKRALSRAGLSNPVHVVSDGHEAVEYLKGAIEAKSSGCQIPLLICLDINMPVLSGFEVLGWIREQPNLKDVPVVIVSQSDNRPDINRASHLGANSYLVKPANFDGLVNMMATMKQMLGTLEKQIEPATTTNAE
jgi:CheY-like chemotaxis protein